jgi:hypothetical protein
MQRRVLAFHHVFVELGRATHGLTRVVHDVVETIARAQQLTTERFDAGRVTQVETKDLQTI